MIGRCPTLPGRLEALPTEGLTICFVKRATASQTTPDHTEPVKERSAARWTATIMVIQQASSYSEKHVKELLPFLGIARISGTSPRCQDMMVAGHIGRCPFLAGRTSRLS
jgi:hypothetical protein